MTLYKHRIIGKMLQLTLYAFDPWGINSDEDAVARWTRVLPLPHRDEDAFDACCDRARELVGLGHSQAEIFWVLDIYNRIACQGALPIATVCYIAARCKEHDDIPGFQHLLYLLCDGIITEHIELGQPITDDAWHKLTALASDGDAWHDHPAAR